ncbi:hypothetical protein [Hymenobacter bucti]|uniref:Uncharacterized protein n=1 Tax=Hymenobacter bucti TaxID=1844114 RepID=A0ABW4QWA3_9BACT
MKILALLLAGSLCSISVAQAQTTPTQTTPTQGAPRNAAVLTPSSAAPALSPNSTDNTRGLPATGAPDAIDNTTPTSDKGMTKGKKQKSTMSSDKRKVKSKM